MKNLAPSNIPQDTLSLDSPLIHNIIAAMQEKKGEHIVSLNLTDVTESIADFFILCNATNIVQLKSIADFIEKDVFKNTTEKPSRIDGKKGQQWIVLDYVNVVVHCMMPSVRELYQLEELWHDANKLTH